MAVVVRNDSGASFRLSGAGNQKEILANQVLTLTDSEFEKIPFSKRGLGGLIAIDPNEASSNSLRIQLDYDTSSGEPLIAYEGMAMQGQQDTDPVWIIRKFNYGVFGIENKIIDIQIMTNVKWSDRTILAWT